MQTFHFRVLIEDIPEIGSCWVEYKDTVSYSEKGFTIAKRLGGRVTAQLRKEFREKDWTPIYYT